ncbi:MAG TPA: 2-iminoacetate synthase ThiH [Lentisphaeria bacterium]|nr:MAG: thiamine biosynthesis protein ThiH [Lentisphaerae bacterium GWF2_50_93]HCE45573.1 2-iminoacetate synthase ThiH [Lentisphaeria bacterium]
MVPYSNIDDDMVSDRLDAVTAEEVLASLGSDRHSSSDFMGLISPAAMSHLPQMRKKAAVLKKMHFGKTVRIYAPLYVSSYCINNCLYCGFRTANRSDARKRLSLDDIRLEGQAIKKLGLDSILLVSGEDPRFVSVAFLEKAIKELKKMFSYVSLEIFPLDVEGYRTLFNAGAHGLTIYQETYNRKLYSRLHPSGPKRNYDYRIEAPARAAEAGFYNIGVGALLGLHDWRSEAVSLASHAVWLRKRFWKSKIQFSFPRITPVEGSFKVPSPVSEMELEQMMLAFRICFPECDITVSTRENCEFRNGIVQNCANLMSAGSSVVPGGYASPEKGELGQFGKRDVRSVKTVKNDLKKIGLEAVFKDWDKCLGA